MKKADKTVSFSGEQREETVALARIRGSEYDSNQSFKGLAPDAAPLVIQLGW